jgi:uncharacterized protein
MVGPVTPHSAHAKAGPQCFRPTSLPVLQSGTKVGGLSAPANARFPDGRLHLQQGPVDCIVEAWGDPAEVEAAYAQAIACFEPLLRTLVGELPLLRSPLGSAYPLVRGPVATRMVGAVWPHREVFITPMAAVAGAVADELLGAMLLGRRLSKAYVNDGGDIALHLSDGTFTVGVAEGLGGVTLAGEVRLRQSDAIGGVATSGWRGRSQSLGIADTVTVLAENAAAADAAATLIANAVNVDHPAIRRLPARTVKEDSDLGDLPVTVEVGPLPDAVVDRALDSGQARAREFQRRGLIKGAYLSLGAKWRTVPPPASFALRARC